MRRLSFNRSEPTKKFEEPMVRRLSAGGRWIRTIGPGLRWNIFHTARSLDPQTGPGPTTVILTTDIGRFTVRRARLAPAMISTPGRRPPEGANGVGPASLVAIRALAGRFPAMTSPSICAPRSSGATISPSRAISCACPPVQKRDSPGACRSAERGRIVHSCRTSRRWFTFAPRVSFVVPTSCGGPLSAD